MSDMLRRDALFRVPEQVATRKVGNETIILDAQTGTYFGLDPVGSRFFELLEAENSLATAIAQMLGEYDVSEEQLENDLLRLTEELLSNGLLESK